MDGIGHIGLGTFPGDKVLLRAGLACHLVDQGNALGLSGEEVVVAVLRDQLQQFAGAGDRQLRIAKADEGADVQVVGNFAQGQLAVQTGYGNGIRQNKLLLPSFLFRRKLIRPTADAAVRSGESSRLSVTAYQYR